MDNKCKTLELVTPEAKIVEPKIPQFTEFEAKYRVDGDKIYKFKEIVENIDSPYEFVYVQGPDYYFLRKDGRFARYRKAENDKTGRAEVTFKTKPEGAKNNITRKEYNWRVDKTPFNEIYEALEGQDYMFNFKISKFCHIYKFKDVTLVFYTVKDDMEKLDHFVEIELDEASIHKLTHDEAMDKIRHYEGILSPLGITYRNRLSKSLYEMYVKNKIEGINV